MITFSNKPKLGYGIYTVADMAKVLGMPIEKVRYWLKEYWDLRLSPDSGERSSWGERLDKTVNFYTLVEFYVFYQLRQHKVSVNQILKSHRLLREKFGTPYPFACHRIMTDGKAIFFSPDGDRIVNATPTLQYNLKEVIEGFLEKMEFGDEDQIASRLYPSGKNRTIVVDPHHQFGQPVIKGTNILAGTLFSLYMGGEKPDFIAAIYDLKKEEVEDAIRFYQKAA
ncbi:MAG: DUF433 domain-containing protein [Saprospiraceae bacterium]